MIFLCGAKTLNTYVVQHTLDSNYLWNSRFDCIVDVFVSVFDSSKNKAASEAEELLDDINSASFVSTLHMMEKMFVIVNSLCEQRESESLLTFKVFAHISGIYKTLQKLRR